MYLPAVPLALQNAEEVCKGPNLVEISGRHDPGDLVQVGEIVRCPGAEQFGKRDRAEGGMAAARFKLSWLQIEFPKLFKTDGANTHELVKELCERFAAAFLHVAPAIESIEGLGFSVLEDSMRARQPVELVSVDQVTNHIRNREGAFTFVAAS